MLMTYQNPQMFIYCHVLTTFLSYANATTGVWLNLPKTKYLVFKGATKILILTTWTFQLMALIWSKIALNYNSKSPNFLICLKTSLFLGNII